MERECPICRQNNPDGATICQSCGSPLGAAQAVSFDLPPNTALNNGRYIIEKTLGSGGFGITYKARDTRLGREVVIKEFFVSDGCVRVGRSVQPVSLGDYEELKQKFLQEAQILAKLKHPGIVEVYDFFEENNTGYMVMEYLRGKSLADLLRERGGRMGEEEAVGYILQVCEALKVVHDAGYLHRDIKPDNIIVCEDGRVVLIDFGAARAFVAGKTGTYSQMLTKGYAPLEQYASRVRLGPYTDIYALGATLYHLLTGEIPVEATDRAHGVEMPSPRERNVGVSEGVSEAVMRAMEIEVNKRPQSVDEFADLLRGSAIVKQAVPQPVAQKPVPPSLTPQPTPVQPTKRKRKALVGVLVTFTIILSLVGIAWKPIQEAREKVRQAKCLSNLHNLMMGIMQYCQDYDERMPLAHNWASGAYPYIRSYEVYRCPSRRELAVGYAYNRYLSGLSLARIESPAEIVCLFESNLGGNNPNDYGDSWIEGGIHLGGNNAGFVDGHCQWFRWQRKGELFRAYKRVR